LTSRIGDYNVSVGAGTGAAQAANTLTALTGRLVRTQPEVCMTGNRSDRGRDRHLTSPQNRAKNLRARSVRGLALGLLQDPTEVDKP
jgi:hypothetical protein